jgi:acyl-CoA thioesterase I
MRLIRSTIAALFLSAAWGQTPDSDRIQSLERQVTQQKRLIADWGGLLRYGSDNTELPAPAPGENRVVFLGDQITESWGKGNAAFFPGKPYLNRGIGGQTSSQLLVRFRQDVIDLHSKVVVILVGTNDIAGIHGPATEEMVLDNLMSMTELAKAHQIRIVLASVPPVCDCFAKSVARERWQGRIVELNKEIEDYAAKSGSVYLDYYSALVGAGGLAMKRELTSDGILPNDAGYNTMASLAEKAIAKALERSNRELTPKGLE